MLSKGKEMLELLTLCNTVTGNENVVTVEFWGKILATIKSHTAYHNDIEFVSDGYE